jgi:hypothetical protein
LTLNPQALRCVDCWINQLDDEDREFKLRQHAREMAELKEPRRIQMGWDCVALVA